MQVRVGCQFIHSLEAPAHAVLQVEPRIDGSFSLVSEQWEAEPDIPSRRYVDGFGNLCRRLIIPAGRSVLRYDALVETDRVADPANDSARQLAASELPNEVLQFTLPSRLCPSDEIADEAWKLFGDEAPGWGRVQTISDWVHNEITFGYGSSQPGTTAADVLKSRKGVCRDFAHLFVACCRAVGVPARYAFGYLPDIDVPLPHDPMDFCAWAEVYLEDRWWTFDPRNNEPRLGRVLIGRGRDAIDVAMVTSFGAAFLEEMTVWADEVAA
jgi:transglutaminase-like putative cysteine protease